MLKNIRQLIQDTCFIYFTNYLNMIVDTNIMFVDIIHRLVFI
jgi:hypothetical protein